ncbi:hypothetical protein ACFL20_13810 [Spirochaetota bacterium]
MPRSTGCTRAAQEPEVGSVRGGGREGLLPSPFCCFLKGVTPPCPEGGEKDYFNNKK